MDKVGSKKGHSYTVKAPHTQIYMIATRMYYTKDDGVCLV
jgi:hypothetical protein